MIEFLCSSFLEIVLVVIIVFVFCVYLQNSTMETIWGDPLEDPKDNPPKSDEGCKELIEDIDEALHDDNPEKSSYNNADIHLEEGDYKNTDFDKDKLENSASDDFSIIYDDLKSKDTISENKDVNENSSKKLTLVKKDIQSNAVDSNNAKNSVNLDLTESTTDEKELEEKDNRILNETDENKLEEIDNGNPNEIEDKNKNYVISVRKFSTAVSISENEDSFIKLVDFSNKMSRIYEVNGACFVGDERLSRHDNDELAEYRLFQMDRAVKDDDEEDMSTFLEMHVQTLPQGVIINANVFLWDAHWNTMVLVDGQLFRCAVCQVYCDRLTCEDHVETESHLRNLDQCRPLKRFDLSIVRKTGVNLHCGVCNEIIDIMDYTKHENNKSHEENLLTAINKVCDLMFDSNIHSSYVHRNFLSAYRNKPNSDRSTLYSDRNTLNSDRNVSTSERMFKNNGEFHFDANAINNNVNVYEEFSEEEEENYEEEEDNAQEEVEEEEEIEEYNTPFQGISYASMASKPTIQLPKFLKIDLGTKEVRVKFESWHMIAKIGTNKFYCMVCSKNDHIRFKSQHCISCEHVERLAKCTIVRAFEDYLIRKVDEKLYHCGHCNNLQYQNQMEDHIESAHPKKNTNYIETINAQNNIKQVNTTDKHSKIEPRKTESDKSAIVNKNLEYEGAIEQKLDFDIFSDIPLSPFGCTLKIPALNFNLITKKGDDYYCIICEMVCEDVKAHVDEMLHVELMTMTPFIKPFQNHLTRAVRGMLHCSLCNKLFPVAEVKNHNIDQSHTSALATAMGMKKSQKPENTKRVTILSLDKDHKLTFNLPPKEEFQKENIKPISPNEKTDKMNHSVNKPKAQKVPNLGQNGAGKDIFDVAGVQARLSKLAAQNFQNKRPNLMNVTKIGQNSQNLATAGQNLPTPGQNLPFAGQNLPTTGHNLQTTGQNLPFTGQNLPNPGQKFLNPPLPQNLKQTVKSIPPMFNAMFPQLPPVNTQNLTQFSGAPLVYTFNPPRPSLSPFPSRTPNESPTLLSPSIPAQNQTKNNQDIGRNTIIITDKNDTITCIDNIRQDCVISKTGSVRWDSVSSKTGSVRRDSVSSKTGSVRRGSESSKTGSDVFKTGSDSKSVLSDNNETDSLSGDEYKEFDEEEMVFVKLKTTYFKISNMSYNTLVFLDNGIRYCFVCSSVVHTSQQRKHVDCRKHMDNLADNKFLDKYGVQLFRQMYLMYHCAVCNELMTRKEIKLHLDWPIHLENYNTAHLILSKKNRKELKSGLKEYIVETQKEAIFHNVNEPNYNIRAAYQIVPSMDVKKDDAENRPAKGSKPTAVKKNKMVIQNNVVMKISFYNWHGITTAKNVTKCVICQLEIKQHKVLEHVETDYHAVALGKTFEKNFFPALIRKINESTVNCMTCNLELPNNDYMIHEHANGRKHNKNLENIVNETSYSDSYADCYEDYLNI